MGYYQQEATHKNCTVLTLQLVFSLLMSFDVIQGMPCDSSTLIRPDIVRALVGSNVTFLWQATVPQMYRRMSSSFGSTDMIELFVDSKSTAPIEAGAYQERISGVFHGSSFGFVLQNVTSMDTVKKYYTVLIRSDGSSCQDVSRLYIYGMPKAPEVTVDIDPNVDVGETGRTTFTCHSESTSEPAELQLPIKYRWSVNGRDVRDMANVQVSGPSGNILIIMGAHPYLRYVTCRASENDSPLHTEKTLEQVKEVDSVGFPACTNCTEEEVDWIPKAEVYNPHTDTNEEDTSQQNVYQVTLFSVLGVLAGVFGVGGLLGYVYFQRLRKPVSPVFVPVTETYLTNSVELLRDRSVEDDEMSTCRGDEYVNTADGIRARSGVYCELDEAGMAALLQKQADLFSVSKGARTSKEPMTTARTGTLPAIPPASKGGERTSTLRKTEEYLLPLELRRDTTEKQTDCCGDTPE